MTLYALLQPLMQVPDRMYFGREVALSDRARVDNFSLKKRSYIGPTSMDCEMAFIMANMGKVSGIFTGQSSGGPIRANAC